MTSKHMVRNTVNGHGQPIVHYISCDVHRKHAYSSRKDAKAVCKMIRRKDATSDLEPYPCDVLDGRWHVGTGHRMKDARRTYGTEPAEPADTDTHRAAP